MTSQQMATTFPAMLDRFKGEIERALPKHLDADRMARIALTAFRRTPKLKECDPRSVFAAVIQSSQLGLELGIMGRADLIPYGRECQFVPGWKGLVELVNRSGHGSVWTGAVFPGDEFEWALGDSPFVTHRPGGESRPERMTHAYAIGRVRGAEWPVIEVWTTERIRQHRDRYNKVGSRHYSYDNWEMYARKVVLLQVLKYMPMSAELATAIALNDSAEVGKQRIEINDAIDGTWAPVPDEPQQNDVGLSSAAKEIAGKAAPKSAPVQQAPEWPKLVGAVWVDSRGLAFSETWHGKKGDGTPSTTKLEGHFRMRRNVDKGEFAKYEQDALNALKAADAQGDDVEPIKTVTWGRQKAEAQPEVGAAPAAAKNEDKSTAKSQARFTAHELVGMAEILENADGLDELLDAARDLNEEEKVIVDEAVAARRAALEGKAIGSPPF